MFKGAISISPSSYCVSAGGEREGRQHRRAAEHKPGLVAVPDRRHGIDHGVVIARPFRQESTMLYRPRLHTGNYTPASAATRWPRQRCPSVLC